MNFEKCLNAALILLVIALSFFIVELPHLETGLPLHSDSYDNIAITQKSIETGTIFLGNPYTPSPEKSFFREQANSIDLQAGYTTILLSATLFGLINPINLPLYFPWIVSLLMFATTFILLKKLCRQEHCAFIGTLFLFFIPSSQLMLGPILLTASGFALFLLPALLLLGHTAIAEKKNQKSFVALTLISGLIYPPAVIVALLSLLVFLAFSPELLKKNVKPVLKTTALFRTLFVMYILFLVVQIGGNLISLYSNYGFEFVFAVGDFIVDQLFFKQNFSQQIPFLDSYLGLPLLLFGLISIGFFTWKYIKYRENSSFLPIYSSAILFSGLAFLGLFFGRGILIPTERMVFFAGYFLLLSGGLFLGKILSYAVQKIGFSGKRKTCFFAVSAVVLCLLVVVSAPVKTGSFTSNITVAELGGIDWINKNTNEDDLILAVPYISKPISIFTGRQVTCTTSTRFGCSYENNQLVSSFFYANCEDKKKILEEYFKADYVLMQKELQLENGAIVFPEQNCIFLEETFNEGNIIIYKSKSLN